jgi:hypothetical protein
MSEIIETTQVEYTIEMFPEGMPKDQREALCEGYVPYYYMGELAGRAYLSKFIPAGIKSGPFPMDEIKITPKEKDDATEP